MGNTKQSGRSNGKYEAKWKKGEMGRKVNEDGVKDKWKTGEWEAKWKTEVRGKVEGVKWEVE